MSDNSEISEIAGYREKLRERISDLRQRYRVASLALFGSRVRGDGRENSDLDVLVRFEVTPTLLTLLKLEHELSDLLGVRVDLVLHDSLRPTVEQRVLQDVVAI